MHLHDSEGVEREVILKDALYVSKRKMLNLKPLIVQLLTTLFSVKGFIIYLIVKIF